MTGTVWAYDDLDHRDTDRSTVDESLRCWLADDGDCSGELREFATQVGPFFLCEYHRHQMIATIDRRLFGRRVRTVA